MWTGVCGNPRKKCHCHLWEGCQCEQNTDMNMRYVLLPTTLIARSHFSLLDESINDCIMCRHIWDLYPVRRNILPILLAWISPRSIHQSFQIFVSQENHGFIKQSDLCLQDNGWPTCIWGRRSRQLRQLSCQDFGYQDNSGVVLSDTQGLLTVSVLEESSPSACFGVCNLTDMGYQ